MKTLHYKVCACLLAFVLSGVTTYSLAQSCLSDSVSFVNEFQIAVNQGPYVLDREQIRKKEALFVKCIRCSPRADSCPMTPIALAASHVKETLYDEAEEIRQRQAVCADNSCITGIWIIFGMENGNIRHLFRTAVLKRTGTSDGDPIFDSLAFGKVYSYTGRFEEKSEPEWRKLQQAYFENIMIQKYENSGKPERGGHRRHDGTLESSWRGNSRLLFYSFQEILGFYLSRNPQEKITQQYFCGNIYINNSAGKFTAKPKMIWHRWHVKHNTFITVDKGDEKGPKDEAVTSVSADGADLAHVCPSRCNGLQYPGPQRIAKFLKKTSKVED